MSTIQIAPGAFGYPMTISNNGLYVTAGETAYNISNISTPSQNAVTIKSGVGATLRKKMEDYDVGTIPELTRNRAEAIKEGVMNRHKRLQDTKASNWTQQALAEERAKRRGWLKFTWLKSLLKKLKQKTKE